MKNFIESKEYNIGLDIGTSSVGWAVTDNDNNIMRFKRKNMWGAGLFDEGKTAASTRLARGQRRRYVRRKERIRLLRQLLEEMVLKVDKTFFLRLEESFFTLGDKTISDRYNLFYDKEFNDKHFFEKYKTIYHLRYDLINLDQIMDPRFIYLALHHIIKYRGNFLYEGQTLSNINNKEIIRENVHEIFKYITGDDEKNKLLMDKKTNEFIEILEDKEFSKKEKQKKLAEIMLVDKGNKSMVKEIANAIVGYKADLAKLFINDNLLEEDGKAIEVEFSAANYDEKESYYQEILDDDEYKFIIQLNNLYGYMILYNIREGTGYISKTMINKYEKHKQDLSILKNLIKTHYKEKYDDIFRNDYLSDGKTCIKNYFNYIKGESRCSMKELYDYIKKILETKKDVLIENHDYKYCMGEIEKDNFLNKLNNRFNGVIPYQLHMEEMRLIIEKQGRYYPELLTNKEKLLSILEFKIPYYVGPLNPYCERFAWVEKLQQEKIYPWNFTDVVDIDKSAEKFIIRMTNYCTYLPDKKVIPKNSLLYSKYEVLNELKQITINRKKLSIEDINKIIKDLFLTKKNAKVKEKDLIDWLKVNQYPNPPYEIRGYQKDKEFASSLKSHIDFINIFGEINNKNYKKIEEIIYYLTVFEDKKIVKKKLKELDLDEEQFKGISKLNYSGWSRLSRELLTEIKTPWKDGSKKCIMDLLEETNDNFMQIISKKDYEFANIIRDEAISLEGGKIKYKHIKDLQGSPAIKRGVWHTVKIVNEIVKIMGREPKNIFIEFARGGDDTPKRTSSRYNSLENLHEKIAKDSEIYNEQILSKLKNCKDFVNNDRYYLYFIQNGKCMYTGESLDLDELDKYQIDHIIPQSYIKDDSLDNRVLVFQKENQNKLHFYPLPYEIRYKMHRFWDSLYKNGLMSNKKYLNLTRPTLDEKTLKRFISRQLVETRQISKHIANLFQENYKNSKVVLIKANLISNFRDQFNIYKNRDINDFHHAHDAYLVSVLGDYVKKRFPNLESEYHYNEFLKYKKKYEDGEKNKKQTSKDRNGYIIATMRDSSYNPETGEIIWSKDDSIVKIKKILNYRDCLITKKLEEETGRLFRSTLLSKDKAKNHKLFPKKKGLDVEKYGGYTSITKAYSIIIQHEVKSRFKKEMVRIPLYVIKESKNSNSRIIDYLEKECDYKNVVILKNKVMKHQLIEENGVRKYIVSDKEIYNAKQFTWDLKGNYGELLFEINHLKIKEDEKKSKSNELNDFYKYFVNKLFTEYTDLYSDEGQKLNEYFDTFCELSLENKVNFINEVIKIVQCSSERANLKKYEIKGVNFGSGFGRIEKKIKVDDTVFIDQSITGLFEKRYRL